MALTGSSSGGARSGAAGGVGLPDRPTVAGPTARSSAALSSASLSLMKLPAPDSQPARNFCLLAVRSGG